MIYNNKTVSHIVTYINFIIFSRKCRQNAKEKAEREAEKAKKNNPMYKLGKKAVNSAETKLINKLLNKLFKNFK